MGKISSFSIELSKPVYESGSIVDGRAVVVIAQTIKIKSIRVNLRGAAKVKWTAGSDNNYKSDEKYIETSVYAYDSGGSSKAFEPGTYSFDFIFELPENIPTSFEGTFGYVRYLVDAKIDASGLFLSNTRKTVAISVIQHLDLNKENAMLIRSVTGTESRVINQGCFSSSSIDLVFKINKHVFVPGENIDFTVSVNNKSKKPAGRLSFRVFQEAEYIGKKSTVFSSKAQSSKLLNTISDVTLVNKVKPKSSMEYKDVQVKVPSCPPSRLDGCQIINLKYYYKLLLELRSHGNIQFDGDIIIGTIPLGHTSDPSEQTTTTPAQTAPSGLFQPSAPPPSAEAPSAPPPSDSAWNESSHGVPPPYNPNWADTPPTYQEATTGAVEIVVSSDMNQSMDVPDSASGESKGDRQSFMFAPIYPVFDLQEHN